MTLRDWLPLIAAVLSFFAALSGAGLGAFFSGRTERLKLLRTERVKACADLMAACRSAVRTADSYKRAEFLLANPSRSADPQRDRQEMPAKISKLVDDLNTIEGDAWNAYHRIRLLGPEKLAEAGIAYWEVYAKLVRSELKGTSLDFVSLAAAEEKFYAAASAVLTR